MKISQKEKSTLRNLAEQQAEIAALPLHKEKISAWTKLNDLKPGRPLVWINEIPWHEMDVNGELELRTSNPFCQQIEQQLRRTIYQWNHMPCDMVVEPKFYSQLVIHDTGFGIDEDVEIRQKDEKSSIVSREFYPQIETEKDIEKIKFPIVTLDKNASDENYQTLVEVFGDILPVEKIGIVHCWFAPWDELIRWWDVQKALMDLILRPELVHMAMDRLVSAYLYRLEQWKSLNLLSYSDGNYRVGSGALGYSSELPKSGYNPSQVRTIDQWGCGTAQIFSDVSPEMHVEFALRYEKRWLENFGLNYYGCCEPLHNKIEILEDVPNLRKISMSMWADVEKMVQKAGQKYVLSYKPNPAVLAKDHWNPDEARKDLETVLEKTQGCSVEIIMKDISTLRYLPQRLWEWAEIAMGVVENF
jgi:hypothetical protein